MKRAAAVTFCSLALAMLLAGVLAPHSYSEQFREAPNAHASRQFPLGTDSLGRDRLSRVALWRAAVAGLRAGGGAAVRHFRPGPRAGRRPRRTSRRARRYAGRGPLSLAPVALRAARRPRGAAVERAAVDHGRGDVHSARRARMGGTVPDGGGRRQAASARPTSPSSRTPAGCPRWRIAAVHILPNLLPLAAAQFLTTVPGVSAGRGEPGPARARRPRAAAVARRHAAGARKRLRPGRRTRWRWPPRRCSS